MAIQFKKETRTALLVAAWMGTLMMGYYGVSSWYAANPGFDGIVMAIGMFAAFAAGTVAFAAVLFDPGNKTFVRILAFLALACLFAIDMWASSHHLQTGTLQSVVSAQNATDDKASQRDYVRTLQSQLAACNPTHVTKCVKPLSDKLAAAQADLQKLSGDSQALKDQVESDSWQWMVDLFNMGARPGEELTRSDVIARFSLFVGGFLYLMIVFAHGLLGSGKLVMEAVGLDDETVPNTLQNHPTPHPNAVSGAASAFANSYADNMQKAQVSREKLYQTAANKLDSLSSPANDEPQLRPSTGFKQTPEQLANVRSLATNPTYRQELRAGTNSYHDGALDTPIPAVPNTHSSTVPNTLQNRPTPHPNAAQNDSSAAEKISDPSNFAVLKKVVMHPKFSPSVYDVMTGAIAPTQSQMKRAHNIGGDQTSWTMTILEAWEIVTEPTAPSGARQLVKTLTPAQANDEITSILNTITGETA
ncbi:MAG: hypothetical protein BWK73_04730 [Thiothrix lacustris]|uniref:Uncharacterized protein n=1 Tax=Thiothrix lacustris TaxID=525917 RepID=A0A1Y1QYF7_9GAMM|nr:MAG: hypothetical protein BWK73_04730 [Thiothrix lacustris]